MLLTKGAAPPSARPWKLSRICGYVSFGVLLATVGAGFAGAARAQAPRAVSYACPIPTASTSVVGDVTVSNQAVVEALRGTTRIDGHWAVSADEPLDLSALDTLVDLERLTISITVAQNPEGFPCLRRVGFLLFFGCTAACDLPAFKTLETLGGLAAMFNPALHRLPGFPALRVIRGDLQIFRNDRLEIIVGFPAL